MLILVAIPPPPPRPTTTHSTGLLAVGYEKFGSEEELLKDPIQHLFQIYVKINVCGGGL